MGKLLSLLGILSFLMFLAIWTMLLEVGDTTLGSILASPNSLSTSRPTAAMHDMVDQIYVISLRNRQSRRHDMEVLRKALGWNWSYVDAVDPGDPLIFRILDWVATLRSNKTSYFFTKASSDATASQQAPKRPLFSWPLDIDEVVRSRQELDLWSEDLHSFLLRSGNPRLRQSLSCASKDNELSNETLPEYMTLTPARVACWHSHLQVIHTIANTPRPEGVGASIILEDDVDTEQDIQDQLRYLFPFLPTDWDVVSLSLGHCWSNEAYHPPLSRPAISTAAALHSPSPSFNSRFLSSLHPSKAPKCTHAYALSRTGARRLLLYLRYPPFAYSRAIDQALSWLVESGRLKSYSVVPSLFVQRKIADSDVMIGKGSGSGWKDTLRNGVLHNLAPAASPSSDIPSAL